MEETEKIMRAQVDTAAQELFIKENMTFIYSCAAQAAGHFVDESDDVFSEALAAFHNALTNYDENKGSFYTFAKTCIHNKIKDYYRVQNRHKHVIPFSSLETKNDNGEDTSFEIEDINTGISEISLEIFSLKADLEPFGISFFELPKAAPKSKKNSQCLC